MAIKEFLCRFRPAQLYIVLILSICYFSLQMVLSHITHALTLLMASYHMLCNIFALTGCILTIKHSKRTNVDENIDCGLSGKYYRHGSKDDDKFTCVNLSIEEQSLRNIECRERKLRNTFGWTRIDVLTMLIVCIILASLSFSLLVEALQTLVHIDHQDSMHLPIPVMVLGFVGLILNGVSYLLIGGYTMHQGSFLHMTLSGDIILDKVPTNGKRNDTVVHNITRSIEVGNTEVVNARLQQNKQNLFEMFRDISSTMFVIVCAFIVYISNDEHTAKFIDPVLSIFSCVVLVSLSYPYMKESCLILLQTIPGSIDMEIFEQTLGSKFPEIISYHDLHIWQLTANKYVSTVHIKFRSQQLYTKVIEDVKGFFFEQGITIVTIQPEFQDTISKTSLECLVQCNANDCAEKVCCQQSKTDLHETSVTSLNLNKDVQLAMNTSEKIDELKISPLSNLNITIGRSKSANNLSNSNASEETRYPTLKKSSCEIKLPEYRKTILTMTASSPDIN